MAARPTSGGIDMTAHPPRILLPLLGDMQREASARIKYGLFADALARQFGTVIPCDVTLRGPMRYLNALQTFHFSYKVWRQRFLKNIAAFEVRSRLVAKQVIRYHPDLVLQIGVTFDASRFQTQKPVYIYTDYTAALSASHRDNLRSPFSTVGRQQWFALETEAYQRAQHIFVRSRLVRDSLVKDYGIKDGKITVCGGGVNFQPLPQAVTHSAKDFPLALFIGKDFKRKSGDTLLQAFALVRREMPNARLRVVTGDQIPASLPLDGVEICPVTWDRGQIGSFYREADFFVLPSRLETWGDVLLEAMAFGLPCVGVKSDAMGEIISAGETGLLIPTGDVPALASAMLSLMGDSVLRARMGRAGRQRVETHFTWEQVSASMRPILVKNNVDR
jgi:glycosyltransferase involved in cell wall biosynthesis